MGYFDEDRFYEGATQGEIHSMNRFAAGRAACGCYEYDLMMGCDHACIPPEAWGDEEDLPPLALDKAEVVPVTEVFADDEDFPF